MHPVLARLLNLSHLQAALRSTPAPDAVGDAPCATRAAELEPQLAQLVRDAPEPSSGRPEVQQAVLRLATQAALESLETDAGTAPRLRAATEALLHEGATPNQARGLMLHLLLEEAFGFDTEVQHFDEALFHETLDCVPALARLTSDRVAELVEAFASAADPAERTLRELAARTLLGLAWQDGPEPISPEHMGALIESLHEARRELAPPRLHAVCVALVGHLQAAGLVGARRAAQLRQATDEAVDAVSANRR